MYKEAIQKIILLALGRDTNAGENGTELRFSTPRPQFVTTRATASRRHVTAVIAFGRRAFFLVDAPEPE